MTSRTLIVCASVHHHNTEKVARAMAEVLGAKICPLEVASSECLDDYELIGFGSGIYFGRFHESLRAWIAGLPNGLSTSRQAFVFSTSGLPWLWQFWHRPLIGLLTQKGFRVSAQFHCSGFDTFGPLWLFGGIHRRHPDERDLEQARNFARNLLKSQSGSGSTKNPPINKPQPATIAG